jgi:hypothetical protein
LLTGDEAQVGMYTGFFVKAIAEMRDHGSMFRSVGYAELSAGGCCPVGDRAVQAGIALALRRALRQDLGPELVFSSLEPRTPETFHINIYDVQE